MTDQQQKNMLRLLGLLFILVLIFFLFGCSPSKRARKAINRIGAEPVAVELTKMRPDLLRGDTVKIDSIIKVPFEVKIPDYIHDTIVTDTGSVCKRFFYEDSKLVFRVYEQNSETGVFYKIKSKIIRDTVTKRIVITEPCPPCPGRTLLDEMKKDFESKMMEKDRKINSLKGYRTYFWIIVIILVILFIIRNLPISKLF